MENNAYKFLAIDDKIENLISLKALIKESFPNSIFLMTQSGNEGLKIAKENEPDVILLDIMMPEINGYDVCKELKNDSILKDIPVVFVTALNSDRETRLKAVEVGAEAFIHKPIDELELFVQLRTLLRLREFNLERKDRINSLESNLSKKSKEVLESEERFRSMVSSTDDIVYTLNKSKFCTGVFGNWFKRSNLDPATIIGKTSFELFGEALGKIHDVQIDKALKGENFVYDWPYSNSFGDFQYQSSLSPIYDDVGNVTGVVGIGRDITKQVLNDINMRQLMIQNKRILDNLQDAYFQADLLGNFVLINPKAVSMYGYQSIEELLNHPASMLYADYEDRDRLIEHLKKDGSVSDYSCKGLKKNGEVFDVSMNVQFVKDDLGNITGTEGLVRDISERMVMEKEIMKQRDHLLEINAKLFKSEEKFKTMLETIPAALFLTVDSHTRIEYLSSYFTEMLGYTYEDLPTLNNWYEKAYQDEGYRKKVIDYTTNNLVKSLTDPNYKTEMISDVTCKDGSTKHVLWKGIMLENQWLGCGFDLTRIHEANNKLSLRLQQSVLAISKIGEMRDVYTAGHQKRVQKLAVEIAQRMKLSKDCIMNISYGALIHDIGKIYIA